MVFSKRTILVSILSMAAIFSYAQSTLKGKVIDSETGEALIASTVRVMSTDTTRMVAGNATTRDGSFSIKSVLPAMFPDDPELDYHNLDGVHNGSEAMTIVPKIKDMPPEEQEATRRNLLKYCELDTYAMVKVWEELERVVGGR